MKIFSRTFLASLISVMIFSCNQEGQKEKGQDQAISEQDTAGIKVPTSVYIVDTSQSQIRWTGKKVTGEHTGKINIQSGKLAAAENELLGGTIIIDMTSMSNADLIDTKQNQDLINHLKSDDFFAVDKYPTSRFEITRISPGEGDKQIISGNLTIKDITQEISFPARIRFENGIMKASGTASIDRTKWNIRFRSGKFFEDLGDKMIYDEMQLGVDLVAAKQQEEN